MITAIFLVAAAILFVSLLMVWLTVRVSQLGQIPVRLGQMDREMDRLRDRIVSLEMPKAEGQTSRTMSGEQKDVWSSSSKKDASVHIRPRNDRTPVIPDVIVPRPIGIPQQSALRTDGPVLPRPVVQPTANPESLGTAAPMPQRSERPETPARRSFSIEERLGQNWLNKLGIITLVTGLALFLGYQLRSLGPVGKSVTGFVLSAAILVAGLVLERRERYRIFARVAIGGGWSLLYFVAFALLHVPAMAVLHSQAADLILMFIVAATMIAHSLRYQSQVVTSLAFLLASFTLTISHVTMFSLVAGAILAAGLVTVAFRQRWFLLVLGGIVAVYINHFLWLQRMLPKGAQQGVTFPQFLPSAFLLVFYWALFRVFYVFRIPSNDPDRVSSTLNVLVNSLGLLALLKYQSSHPEWAFQGLLALGVAELAFAFIARRRHHNAFAALASIGSLLMLTAIPFHFAGTSWSLLWLLQAEMLIVAGVALREPVFRRLGLVSSFAAIAHLVMTTAAPIFNLRQVGPDASHHLVGTVAFAFAAVLAWFNAEYVNRRWPAEHESDIERSAVKVLSYIATGCACIAAWLAFAGPWTILPWLALAVSLAIISDRVPSVDLAQQSDLVALAAVLRMVAINFGKWNNFARAPRSLIALAATTMLYLMMRRRQSAYLLRSTAISPFYSWVAATGLAAIGWYALQPAAVSIAWALLGVALIELGLATEKRFFRHQGLALLAASFIRLYFINIGLAPTPRLYSLLSLGAAYGFAYQRLHATRHSDITELLLAKINAWFATGTLATLLYFSLRPEWVAIGGALLATSLLVLARVSGRQIFTAQGMTVAALAASRALAFNVFSTAALAGTTTEGRIFPVCLTCAILLGALPVAFSIRKAQRTPVDGGTYVKRLLRHPEQLLFFAPLIVLFGLMSVRLRAGMITVGWSALGLSAFLFALAVSERSFRLSGLGLLLLALGKVIVVDVWNATPTDRYITLIVLGGVLLLVSFLYSRYRETILEFL